MSVRIPMRHARMLIKGNRETPFSNSFDRRATDSKN
jgi:hypothetical protein